MTYTVGVPFDGQSLSNSKPQIRSNFSVINTAFSTNHLALGAIDQGKHKFLQMPNQSAAPTTSSNESGFYAKSAQSFSNLFWRQESGGADPLKNQGAEIQLTNVLPTNASKGCTFLPGGLLMQWESKNLSGGSVGFSFTRQFTLGGIANNPWSIVVGLGSTPNTIISLGVSGSSVSSTGFSVNSFNGTNQLIYYIAIGPRT